MLNPRIPSRQSTAPRTSRAYHTPRGIRFALAAVTACVAAIPLVFAATPASASSVNYVALGDSYASGLGAGNYSGGSCDRSANAAAQLWANAHSPASFAFVACSGATTSDVINSGPAEAGLLAPGGNSGS